MSIYLKDKDGSPSVTLTMVVVSFILVVGMVVYQAIKPEHNGTASALELFGLCIAAWRTRQWVGVKAGTLGAAAGGDVK